MEFIRVTEENIAQEHICCAIAKENDIQVQSKKAWLTQAFADGLVFLKADVRGKCFIEYLPAEHAWVPLQADGYMYIDCLWVSGSLKGQGYSNTLLNECIRDSKKRGLQGICILSSPKKRPFLADPKFLIYKAFRPCDESDCGIQLWYLPFSDQAPVPAFRACAKHPRTDGEGFTVYYTHQCPFNAKYIPVLEETARENGIPFRAVHLQTKEAAQQAPTPVTTYAVFWNGAFVTNEQMNEKRLLKLYEKLKG